MLIAPPKRSALAALALVGLIALAFIVASPTFDRLISEWDDGNNLYGGLALLHGQTPNIDFVHGYPGLQALLNKGLFSLFGLQITVSKIAALAATLVTASCVFVIANALFGTWTGALFFWGVFLKSYLAWPSQNPGFTADALVALAAVGVFFFADAPARRKPLFFAAAFLIGLSTSFKQSGLFAVLGLTTVTALAGPWTRGVKRALVALVSVAPLAAFLVLRLPNTILEIPANSLALVGWLAAVVLANVEAAKSEAVLSLRDVIVAAALTLVGGLAFLAVYPEPVSQAATVIRQIYAEIPKLIDRHLISALWADKHWELVAGLAVVAVLMLPGIAQPRTKTVWRLQVAGCALFAAFAVWSAADPVRRAAVLAFFESALSPYAWDDNLFPALVGGLGVGAIVARKIQLTRRELLLLVLGLTYSGMFYPYPFNFRYATVALLSGFAAAGLFIRRSNALEAGWRRNPLYVVVFAVVSALALYTAYNRAQYRWTEAYVPYEGLPTRVSTYRNLEPFLDATRWLSQERRPNETVGGYPDYAIIGFFLDTTMWGRYPTFIGTPADYARLVDEIKAERGPDYFLISPSLYPYQNFPYFEPAEPLLNALEATGYAVAVTFPGMYGEPIRIYRRLPAP